MNRKTVISGVVVLVALLGLGGYFVFSDSNEATDTTQEESPLVADKEKKSVEDSEVESDENVKAEPRLIIGDEDAPVTIVEYSDFQCPFCARFFRETEPQIRDAYIDDGLVNIDYRPEIHIGEGSIVAAQGAYCAADQDKFETYHSTVFTKRGNGELSTISKSAIRNVATTIDLNQEKFNECLANDTYREIVLESHNEARQDVGINQTPTFIIGNRRIAGAQPFSVFKPIIDAELARTH